MLSVCSASAQRLLSVCSACAQRVLSVCSRCASGVLAVCSPCARRVLAVCLLCARGVLSVCSACAQRVLSVYSRLCIYSAAWNIKKSKSTIEPRKANPAKYANEQPELDSISQLLLERILHFFDPRLRIANPNSDYHL